MISLAPKAGSVGLPWVDCRSNQQRFLPFLGLEPPESPEAWSFWALCSQEKSHLRMRRETRWCRSNPSTILEPDPPLDSAITSSSRGGFWWTCWVQGLSLVITHPPCQLTSHINFSNTQCCLYYLRNKRYSSEKNTDQSLLKCKWSFHQEIVSWLLGSASSMYIKGRHFHLSLECGKCFRYWTMIKQQIPLLLKTQINFQLFTLRKCDYFCR